MRGEKVGVAPAAPSRSMAGELLEEARAWRDRVRALADVDPEVLTSAGVLSGAGRGEFIADMRRAADALDSASYALTTGAPVRFGGAS